MEKNPSDRYRSAGELADDLQRYLDHRPIQARRSRVIAHAKSLWRRHQVLFVAVLTAVRLWNLATREELFVVRRLESNSNVLVDFSPDGRRLAAAANDRDGHGHVFVWSTDSQP